MRPLPVPPNSPAGQVLFNQEVVEFLRGLAVPEEPQPTWACLSTALPDAATYPGCVARVTDLSVLAVSDGADWIRQDTGVAI